MVHVESAITIGSLMWLFLAAFMIHDLEEIIFVESWWKKHGARIKGIAPGWAGGLVNGMAGVKSSQFAAAVLTEFVVFVPVTYLAVERQSFVLFVGANALMLFHVLTHVGQSLFARSLTPGVVTSVLILLPYGIYLFYRLIEDEILTLREILTYAPAGLFVIPLVLIGHKIGKLVIKEE
ncbi:MULTISPECIES: HXXEE domain-containing protein [Cohnella]|uniref:HXXEE domain-containing protein n=1 Tax=Cohnella TaxID=329857 RepID=UPI001F07939F|nr:MULTISPECIES: HXXEE domain-containing protein [Cohnella]